MTIFKEKAGVKHGVDLIVKDKYGRIKDERHYGDIQDGVKRKIKDNIFIASIKKILRKGIDKDLITNAGKAAIAALILTDVAGDAFDYLAIGTGSTAPSASDTSLEAETHREAGTGTRVTTSVTNDTAQLECTFSGYTTSEAVTEIGMFNAASGGDMLMRQTFSVLNLDFSAGDSLDAIVKVQVTS